MNSAGCLYVVATPIGNLGDISERAVRTLESADLIACEDTRTSGRLLKHLGISTPMISYHEHNEEQRSAELLKRLVEGESIALISDAGTPLMSDPGYRLVSLCRHENLEVHAIPGPSAGIAALSVSGLPTDRFLFAGFLPKGKGSQAAFLDELKDTAATLIFYLPVHTALSQIKLITERLGDRQAFLVREMTKLYETSIYGTLSGILAHLADSPLKGEITLLVRGGAGKTESKPVQEEMDAKAYLYGLMKFRGLSGKDAVRVCSRDLGLPRKKVYETSLEIRDFIRAEE